MRNIEIEMIIAQSEYVSVSVLNDLSNHSNEGIRRMVAMNPNTPNAIVERLYCEGTDIMQCACARAKSISIQLCNDIIHNPLDKVRETLAYNKFTPLSSLETLANDASSDVRRAVLFNDSINLSIIEKLMTDSDGRVSKQAKKTKLLYCAKQGIEFDILVKDPQQDVRKALLSNEWITIDALNALTSDTNKTIQDGARRKLKELKFKHAMSVADKFILDNEWEDWYVSVEVEANSVVKVLVSSTEHKVPREIGGVHFIVKQVEQTINERIDYNV